jgi:hypothetical protein
MDQASTHRSGPIALFAVASLLLTFFVVLNAMSERDQARVREVADSFATRTQVGPGPASVVPIDGNAPAVKVVERRWLDLFPGAMTASGSTFGPGHVLQAELGVAGIFAPGRAEPLASANAVLAALARILEDAPGGLELSLDVRLGLDGDGNLALERVRSLARVLGQAETGRGEVAVGVQHGRPGVVALDLRTANRPLRAQPIAVPEAPPRALASRPGS